MRFKILQQGGLVYNPLIINPTIPSATTTTTAKDTKSDLSGFELDDMVKEMIKTNGVTSDANYFFESVATVLNNPFSDLETSTGQLSQLSALMSLANRVKNNKTFYDNAVSNLNETNTWSDVAMTTSGRIYVYSEKGIDTITPEEYYKSEKEYTPLTNAQLIELRSTNEQFAFNESVLNDLSSAIGVDSLVEYVKKLVNDLSTTKLEGYTVKKQNQIQQGLEALLQLAPDGYYQLSSSEQAANKTEALRYLYSALTPNMKRYLDVKVAVEGGNPKSNDRFELLSMILMNNTDSELGVKYDDKLTENSGINPGTVSKDKMVNPSYLSTIFREAPETSFNIMPFRSGINITVKGKNLGPLVDHDLNQLSRNNLEQLLNSSEILKVADRQGITFGSTVLDRNDWNAIVWDGESSVKEVWLPATTDNGRIVPNFEAIEIVRQINENLNNGVVRSKISMQEELDDKLGENVAYYDEKNNVIVFYPQVHQRFISFSGYASDRSIDLSNNDFVYQLSKQEGKQIKEIYNNLVHWGSITEGKGDSVYTQPDAKNKSIYQGNIFIHVDPIQLGAIISEDLYEPVSHFTNIGTNAELRARQVSGTEFKTTF